jgi:hypothetical protein
MKGNVKEIKSKLLKECAEQIKDKSLGYTEKLENMNSVVDLLNSLEEYDVSDNLMIEVVDNPMGGLYYRTLINTIVSDVYEDKDDENKITILVDIYLDNTYEKTCDVNIDVRDIGLTSDMDYMYDLSKEIDRIVTHYYTDYVDLPNGTQIANELLKLNYVTIELGDE